MSWLPLTTTILVAVILLLIRVTKDHILHLIGVHGRLTVLLGIVVGRTLDGGFLTLDNLVWGFASCGLLGGALDRGSLSANGEIVVAIDDITDFSSSLCCAGSEGDAVFLLHDSDAVGNRLGVGHVALLGNRAAIDLGETLVYGRCGEYSVSTQDSI